MSKENLEEKWKENEEQTPEDLQFMEPQESTDVSPEDSFEDEFESGDLLTNVNYDVPTNEDAFVDGSAGNIIKKDDMTPFEIIKAIAKENGVDIQDPSKGCKKCHGRGYEGFETKTKMPFPCRCLYRNRTEIDKMNENLYDSEKMNKHISRAQRRRMAKFLKNNFKKQMKIMRKLKAEGKSFDEEPKEPSARYINKVLREYIKLSSFKKTASSLDLTLTETKRIIKENKTKLEKMLKKGNK